MVYDTLIQTMGITPGDRIWLSSDLIPYILSCKKKQENFDPSELLTSLQHAVGQNGTILIPTFNFDFSNKQFYDYRNTKGTSGILGNIALERKGFTRTLHPLHSFAVWGKDAKKITSMDNKHSFGTDSPFGYCYNNHVKQIILGTDYVHAMTFIHYAEFICKVPYRVPKSFNGTYVDAEGKAQTRSYDYAARKLEFEPEEQFNRMGLILEENQVSSKVIINGIENYIIDLTSSFSFICNDINNNMCRNIYDFNIPREKIFI